MSIDIQTAHKANIHIPYGQLQTVLDWCDRNCGGDYRFIDLLDREDSQSGRWEFVFESERDYVAFLMWKK